MSASAAAKSAGLKSLAEVSEITGKPPQTLRRWHTEEPALFRVVLLGCARQKEKQSVE